MKPTPEQLDHLFANDPQSGPVLLDGATGTELGRRGISTTPPLWSCQALLDAPELVQSVHQEHVDAGANIVVAHTFRCGPRALAKAGIEDQGADLAQRAVALARATGSIVGVSVAPVEDCYAPESAPDDETLRREHNQFADWLAAAEPDLIWIETMNTAREAGIAAQAAASRGMPYTVHFVLSEERTLLSGDSLQAGFDAVFAADKPPHAIGINCIPPKGATRSLPLLLEVAQGAVPISVYAHVGNLAPIPGWSYAQTLTAEEYAEAATRWVDMGAAVVGGCCGTTSAHVAAIRSALDRTHTLKDPRWHAQ